jgi:hypothetical protein
MAEYNTGLGMWKASDGTWHNSGDEARAHEAELAGTPTPPAQNHSVDLTDFQNNAGTAAKIVKPVDPNDEPNPNNPGGMSNNDLWNNHDYNRSLARATANSNAGTGGGFSDKGAVLPVPKRTTGVYGGSQFTDSHGRQYERVAETPEQRAAYDAQLGTVQDHGMAGGAKVLTLEPPTTAPGGGAPGTGGTSANEAAAREATQRAGNEFDDVATTHAAENTNLWADAHDAIDNLKPTDYGLSDEARGYQREGLQQQRMLLEKMLGFDPNQYASQFADQALARQVALGRSQGGGAAAQQAGIFAAMDQAPALYAEGARQASSLENQRLGMAETAAKAFGDLGTLTRGQDEGRAQFESQLGLNIANSVADLTKGQVQLNQQDTQMWAEMYTDFAKLQSVYSGMSSQEQIAWWQNETAKRGQDQHFDEVMATLRNGGAVSDKDLLNGLFSLGGAALTGGMSILASGAKK